MQQVLFDSLCEEFKKLEELNYSRKHIVAPTLKSPEELAKLEEYEMLDYMESLVKQGNPYQVISDYFILRDEIIQKLKIINNDWVKQYLYEYETFKDKVAELPEIFTLFVSYTENLNKENYMECDKLKKIILNYK